MTPVIDEVRVRVLGVPLGEPVRMSFAALTTRHACLVEIDAGGATGVGESWVNHPSWAWRERAATLLEGAAPLLLGEDASDVAALRERLCARLLPLGRQWGAPGPVWQAVSGVDMALWDLAGKLAGRPVAALAGEGGGTPRRVPVYGSGIGPDKVGELTVRALELGCRAVKVKVGFGRERDEATLRAARAEAGDGVELFADANQAWSEQEAAEMVRLLQDHGVAWCEEPLAGDDPAALERLHALTGMPIATGENVYTLDAYTRYVAAPGVEHIQPDASKTGGITTALEVARLAARHGTAFTPHCYSGALTLAATAHVAAAGGADWVELDVRDNPLRTGLTEQPLHVEGGMLTVPDGPGLGVVIDEARIAPHIIHSASARRTTS